MSEPDPPRTSAAPAAPAASTGPTRRVRPSAAGLASAAAWLGRHRLPRWASILVVVVAVLAVAAVVAGQIELNEFAVMPGNAQPVAPLITVPADRAHAVHGPILLTDVLLSQVSALDYPFDLMAGAQFLPAATVLGPITPPSQLQAQGYLQMSQSQAAAKAAALTRLGEAVRARDVGVVVFSVVPGSPASGRLQVGQLISAVDGRAVHTACAFSQALAQHRAGSVVHLTVERTRLSAQAVLLPGPTEDERVHLARWPASVERPAPTPSCPGATRPHRGFLGVEVETQVDYSDPIPISIRTTSIGGPSAGLAMTLGIIDLLSNGHLTGGRTVAATGTIAADGAVGDVGGVHQKTVAVERAGASVFFVPAGQRATAESAAVPGLRIYAVHSLTQALSDLARLGGSVPNVPSPGS